MMISGSWVKMQMRVRLEEVLKILAYMWDMLVTIQNCRKSSFLMMCMHTVLFLAMLHI